MSRKGVWNRKSADIVLTYQDQGLPKQWSWELVKYQGKQRAVPCSAFPDPRFSLIRCGVGQENLVSDWFPAGADVMQMFAEEGAKLWQPPSQRQWSTWKAEHSKGITNPCYLRQWKRYPCICDWGTEVLLPTWWALTLSILLNHMR